VWSALATIAVLWPSRLIGPLDGAPLDSAFEACLLGLAVPVIWLLQPRAVGHRVSRVLIVLLLLWKAASAALFVQDGWCLRYTTSRPLTTDLSVVPHTWDVRADWHSSPPACSAIVTRPYFVFDEFPIWFFNLPPPTFHPPDPEDRPPHAHFRAQLSGFLDVASPGTLALRTGPDMRVRLIVGGREAEQRGDSLTLHLPPANHRIDAQLELRGQQWQLQPLWNGNALFTAATATTHMPSAIDRWVRPWGRHVSTVLVSLLLVVWTAALVRSTPRPIVLSATGLALVCSAIAYSQSPLLMRATPLVLLPTLWLRVPPAWQTPRTAMLLVGVPWLAFIGAYGIPQVGVTTLYSAGDDWWTFQRYAYRIYLQGYWLEGGQLTFWFQPLYRWIVGALHLVFGDSSVGELFWDAAAIVACAMFTHTVVARAVGWKWAQGAAVTCLASFTLGPAFYLIGRGLSELTSAGFIAVAGLAAIRARSGDTSALLLAAVSVVLAFYTRLNNLPVSLAVAAFALPLTLPALELRRWHVWREQASRPVLLAVIGGVCVGIYFFTWRTWYYTDHFDMFYGTQAGHLSVWQSGTEGLLQRLVESVLVIVTMADPPKFDPRALPLVVGFAAAVLAAIGVPGFRSLPGPPVALCLAGIITAVVARGTAYPGRFSVHLIAVATALAFCMVANAIHRSTRG
jgi:hypothetical protein